MARKEEEHQLKSRAPTKECAYLRPSCPCREGVRGKKSESRSEMGGKEEVGERRGRKGDLRERTRQRRRLIEWGVESVERWRKEKGKQGLGDQRREWQREYFGSGASKNNEQRRQPNKCDRCRKQMYACAMQGNACPLSTPVCHAVRPPS